MIPGIGTIFIQVAEPRYEIDKVRRVHQTLLSEPAAWLFSLKSFKHGAWNMSPVIAILIVLVATVIHSRTTDSDRI